MGFFSEYTEWLKKDKSEVPFAIGMNSSVDIEADEHIIVLDFDTSDYTDVKTSVRECQEFWKLADAHIYATRNGYHAIFFEDQVPFSRVKMIVEYARHVDPMFKYASRFHDHKTLRTAGKHRVSDVEFQCVLPGCRVPSPLEIERGALKRKEHAALCSMKVGKERKGGKGKL